MSFDFKMIPDEYELIKYEYIKEVSSGAGLIRHKKSGARLAVLSNDDDNKVFTIGFRTPPTDSTGVAHIMEHSVLCGSDKYPVKEPFVELMKGSLNTFLNAMTYPDKTVYPVASCNDADFQNLMDVYLDAVFHPNIYIHDEIFRQEGWHFELTDKDEPLIYNGVVYNEMKGAFSSSDDILMRKISTTLYPDSVYGVESGGDPDCIPDLTYEQFLDFHRRYYHPSNSYIYLYGDMDVAEKLEYLDKEYLSKYDVLDIESSVSHQEPFVKPVHEEGFYPVTEVSDSGKQSFMAVNWVINEDFDQARVFALQILEYVLMETPGAPLKKALLDKEYGDDIYGICETGILQPYLSVIIKNMDPSEKDEILTVINDTLFKIADEGISRKTLEGVLNTFEFRSREADYGRYPKGLMYGLQMFDSWLYYEDKPFDLLKYEAAYSFLKNNLDTGYFENLISKYLLNNSHSSVVVLKPDDKLALENEEKLAAKLQKIKDNMTASQIDECIRQTSLLKEYQSMPSSAEDLQKIPMLSISDIRKEALPIINYEIFNEKTKILHHDYETNGICYVKLLFSADHIPESEVPVIRLLSEALGYLDTDDHTYQELTDEINLNTGGITTSADVFDGGNSSYSSFFTVTARTLAEKTEIAFDLIKEILLRSHFDDEKRIKEVLGRVKSRLEMGFLNAGHQLAFTRCASYFDPAYRWRELTSGIDFYRYVCSIMKDEKGSEKLLADMKSVLAKIIRKQYLLIDWTSNSELLENGREYAEKFAAAIPDDILQGYDGTFKQVSVNPQKNEAFVTPGMVQYNAYAGNFLSAGLPYHGSMNVLKNVLGSEYLWNNVRVKNGAYGCMCGFGVNGKSYFTSYRDPKLDETYEIYDHTYEYVKNLELDDRELIKYIIGAFGVNDVPMGPSAKGLRSFTAYITGRTIEEIQKTRDEMLETDCECLRAQADAVKAVTSSGYFCTVGTETAIKSSGMEFEHIMPLLD